MRKLFAAAFAALCLFPAFAFAPPALGQAVPAGVGKIPNGAAIWALRDTAGKVAPTRSGAPTGFSKDGPLYYGPAGSWTLDNWAVKDGQLVLRAGTGVISNTTLNNPGTGPANSAVLNIGDLGTPAVLKMTNCAVSGAGMVAKVQGSAAALVTFKPGVTVEIDNCRFDRAPLVHLKSFATTLKIANTFFGTFGHDAGADAHMEPFFLDAGDTYFANVLIDTSAVDTDPLNKLTTGIGNVEAQTYSAAGYFKGCVVKGSLSQGAATGGIAWTFQIGAKKAGLVARLGFEDCAIEKGKSGYVGITETNGGKVYVTAKNVYDLNTGARIDDILTYPKGVTPPPVTPVPVPTPVPTPTPTPAPVPTPPPPATTCPPDLSAQLKAANDNLAAANARVAALTAALRDVDGLAVEGRAMKATLQVQKKFDAIRARVAAAR